MRLVILFLFLANLGFGQLETFKKEGIAIVDNYRSTFRKSQWRKIRKHTWKATNFEEYVQEVFEVVDLNSLCKDKTDLIRLSTDLNKFFEMHKESLSEEETKQLMDVSQLANESPAYPILISFLVLNGMGNAIIQGPE